MHKFGVQPKSSRNNVGPAAKIYSPIVKQPKRSFGSVAIEKKRTRGA